MMSVFHFRGTSRNSLERRRLLDHCRRALTACAAGLAVFAALHCVMATVETGPIVVAAVALARGDVIRDSDVTIRTVPASNVLDGALRHIAEANGNIAQTDIAAGTPLLTGMIGKRPVTPPGYTVIDVRLAGGWQDLIPGDVIALSAAGVCEQSTDSTDTCVVAGHAVTMGSIGDDGTGGVTLPLALPADEALHILSLQEQGMIVAVARSPD